MNVSYSKSQAAFWVYAVLLTTLVVVTFLYVRSLEAFSVTEIASYGANLVLGWVLIPVKVVEYAYLHKVLDPELMTKVGTKWQARLDAKSHREFTVVPHPGGVIIRIIPERSVSTGRSGPTYTLKVARSRVFVTLESKRLERWWQTWILSRLISAMNLRAIYKMFSEPPPEMSSATLVPPDVSE